MPPRSKQTKQEWASCDICGCNFSMKDIGRHTTMCTKEHPFVPSTCKQTQPVTLLTVSSPTKSKDRVPSSPGTLSVDHDNHGVVYNKKLFGPLLSVDAFPENLSRQQCLQLVFLNPSTMRMCGLSIGYPVMIDHGHILTAWPSTTSHLTTVGMAMVTMETILNKHPGDQVHVNSWTSPCVDALEIHVQSREAGLNFIQDKGFKDYLVKYIEGQYITVGNTIPLVYYAQPCSLVVSRIVGVDGRTSEGDLEEAGTRQPSEHCNVPASELSSVTETLGNISVSGNSSGAHNIHPKKEDTPDQRACSACGPFFKITSSTKLHVQNPLMENGDSKKNDHELSLGQIGGLDTQIHVITDLMEACLFKSLEMRHQGLSTPHGIILYGPSGAGKTVLAKALANSTTANVLSVSGAEIWSKFYGESEARLRSIFQEAKERAPTMLIIDDVDSLCPKRESSQQEVEKRVVATFLTLLDELLAWDGRVFVLATTNKRDDLDLALRRPGRFDREIEIGVPSAKDRMQILQRILQGIRNSLAEEEIQEIADNAHGFVGADLAAVCKEAGLHALKSLPESGEARLLCLAASNLSHGLKAVQPTAMREVAIEVPKVSWSDIGGQAQLKHKLTQAIEWPLKHPEAFARLGIRPPKGLLMYGPPGCSKTMIAKALARESGINFIAIKGPELFSKWVGESERAVRELFRRAKAAAPAIVFFDEIDALAGERGSHGGGGGGDVSDRVLAQLLTEMDGVEALEDVTVVAATNRPDLIDKALMRPGRLDRIVYVPLPDTETRQEIFTINCRRTPVAEDVSISELVEQSAGYSGAEVAAVSQEAALCAMQEDINTSCVHMRHFRQALEAVTPRTSAQLLQLYDKYQESSGLHSI